MKLWIEAVLALQALDMKIRAYRTKLSAVPIEKERLEGELKAATDKLNEAKSAQFALEKKLKELESSAAVIDDNVKKLLTQSVMVKKNTEYQAMMTDIENKKKEISNIETEELTLMDEIEAAKEKVKSEEHELAVCTRAVKTEMNDLKALYFEIKDELKKQKEQRELQAAKVERAVIESYERLLARDKGEPMGKLSDDGVCSCCGCKVTPQTASNTKKGQITYCDNCSHLLYYQTEE